MYSEFEIQLIVNCSDEKRRYANAVAKEQDIRSGLFSFLTASNM